MIFNNEVYCDVKIKIASLNEGISCIYFLKYNDSICYIGQSICLKRRLSEHLGFKDKPFNDFNYISTDINILDSVEAFYILYFSPPFNKKHCLKINSRQSFIDSNSLNSKFVYKFKHDDTLKSLARYLECYEKDIIEIKKENPKLFTLIWSGWVKYCSDVKHT